LAQNINNPQTVNKKTCKELGRPPWTLLLILAPSFPRRFRQNAALPHHHNSAVINLYVCQLMPVS